MVPSLTGSAPAGGDNPLGVNAEMTIASITGAIYAAFLARMSISISLGSPPDGVGFLPFLPFRPAQREVDSPGFARALRWTPSICTGSATPL